ncbi:DUF692 domain-containing protein [Legionella londiniensis]|uniref:UPF0276 protein Llon_0317 n=1 Tax=Legionella londiniensis TaxID=45068 RepID=A0A0W0VS65_9GAMM|nr:DUF692 domain-containing protein [Legionella londiniensis]KTD22927.1 hypothetical protein Llon_0317 [Legionella londiniensis]STX92965.1 Protein of uncharacterised function (DUF692) [Legionella londiniensis]
MASKHHSFKPGSYSVGVGLRSQHYQEFLTPSQGIDFLEVHPENYFGKGGNPHYHLERIAKHYPLSFHGVGLSLGSTDGINKAHLEKLKSLIDCYEPILVSEHLCWTSVKGIYFNDLLPLPYTEESLDLVINHINQVQDYLKRPILIENISTYLEFEHSEMPEYEFINQVIKATGCGMLLDINNLYVNANNHGWCMATYLNNLPFIAIEEIHLAGFTRKEFDDGSILIDTHDKPVAGAVWDLYIQCIQRIGSRPTLIEWDKDLPELTTLLKEAEKAKAILENAHVAA